MLNTETKRRIDNARDILVGKVPDPKSQVEQITLALIYKFMDDMDKQSEEWGGKASFFTGEFTKYSWSSIFDPKLGGYELLNLYSEALLKMNQNPKIPILFREIFKNAYLPYRDPETLKSFLKEINGFCYDHSEKLGDAYEYLLSVLGSQGDAGQFRTPRHIIDFMVKVLDPKKNETILDPACGTAGFLISSFKHIMEENTKETYGDQLTPEEKNRLITNFTGYDISPDMVRISLVNMYLHGFADPEIHEYDTLTSEERWNDTADVILANPPFMSPTGGIRPHRRFSIQANRSEVLFVDYISEHLNNNGRAGIIVPEGIIFQSGNAYKALRKMLVENYLYAVVSLPAGVFNPYAGVKTSILFIDKALAKKAKSILFVKVGNDGFDLGAQRREIHKNDLPEALQTIIQYKEDINNGSIRNFINSDFANIVPISTIAGNGGYILSFDRYKPTKEIPKSTNMMCLQEVCEIITDGAHETPTYEKDGVIFLSSKNVTQRKIDWNNVKYISQELHERFSKRASPKMKDILLAKNGTTGIAAIVDKDVVFDIYVSLALLRPNNKVLPEYLLSIINSALVKEQFDSRLNGIGVPNLHLREIKEVVIPIPTIEEQRKIVSEIEGYQKIIDGAKQVIENYKPQIKIDPEWEWTDLGNIFEKVNDNVNPQIFNGFVNYIGLENIVSNSGELCGDIQSQYQDIKSTKIKFIPNDILYGKLRPNLNKVHLAEISGICSTDILVLRAKRDSLVPKFFEVFFRMQTFNQKVLAGIKGAQLPRIGYDHLSSLTVPIPDIETQNRIVAQLVEEQAIVLSNKRLISIMEQKIKDLVNEIWEIDKI